MPNLGRRYLPGSFLLFVFCLNSYGWLRVSAQDKAPPPNPKEEQTNVFRMDTDLVSIDVQVTDRQGAQYGTKLSPEDFVVYEDGVRQKISNFSATEVPFNLVLLLDTSGSTRDELSLMQKAARRFLTELRPHDRVAIIQFNQQVELIKDLTADRGKLEKALGQLTGGSGTSFYDAVQLALDEVLRKATGRKAIVALTDGVDSFGFGTYEKLLPKLESARAALYFLKLDTEEYTEARMLRDCRDSSHFKFSRKQLKKYFDEFIKEGDPSQYEDHCKLERMEKIRINRRLYEAAGDELEEMSSKTGGHVYPVESLQQLAPKFTQIAAELRTQYSLAYYPSNEKHDGKWRGVRIEIKKPGLTVQARPGYRAPLD
ncbi:MAG: VWA domain-containing protein [Acidobacteria bacterium]|nr:VWA domain-containing protein [Acidobacteriota bacterium]MBI3422989.1 VWA domain-containing protein [Acidobacteriota bacterium]